MPRLDGEIQLGVDLNVDDVKATATTLSNDLEKVFDKIRGTKLEASFRSLLSSMNKAIQKSDELQERMEHLENVTVPTNEYKLYQDALNKLNEKFYSILDKQQKFLALGGKTTDKPFQSMDYDLNQIHDKIVQIKDDMRDLRSNGEAFIPGADTEEYDQLVQQLNEVNNQMVIYQQRVRESDVLHSKFSKVVKILGALDKQVRKVIVAVAKLVGHLGKIAGSAIINGIRKLGSSLTSLGKNSDSVSDKFEHGFKTFIKYAFGVRSFFFLFRKIRKAVIEGFGDLAQVSDPFNRAVSNILTALTMLRNSLASAFSPIIQVVSPILVRFINLLSEVITKIGMMIAALTGQKTYMRALPVYQDYAASLDNSSKNADSAAKSAKKLNKEAKELKKTLAGFDDVEILKGPDKDNDTGDTGSGGDSGSGLGGGGQAFAQLPIGETFTNLSKLLKEAWEKADFTEIGRIIGEKLKSALEKIPWTKIKSTLRKIAKSIATLLNGFLEVPGLFDVVGKTIAEAINSAFEFVESFVSNFHWSSLGNAIKDLIISTLNNIDWPLIYQTMKELGAGVGEALNTAITDPLLWTTLFTSAGNLISAVLAGIDSFLQGVDWGLTGSAIGQGLNDAINNFNWGMVAQTLIDLINGAFDLWYNFVTTFNFTKFGEHIGTTLSTVINGINWKEGAASVAATMTGLFEALNGFMEKTDFKEIGHKVVIFIGEFLNKFDWKELGEFLHNCLQSLCDFFLGIYEEIDWEKLPENILTVISDFMKGFSWKETAKVVLDTICAEIDAKIKLLSGIGKAIWNHGKDIIDGIKKGIVAVISGIGVWITTHIFNPFKEAFNKAFGINGGSASKMESSGKAIPKGVKQGVADKWSKIGDYVTNHVSTIKDAFNGGSDWSWFSIGTNIVSGIIDGLNAEDGPNSALSITAWNLAIGAYNSMVSALSIGSPSKLFRDNVGKMIPAGMALGILDNAGLVDDAMTDLTDTVTDAGKKALEIPAVVKGGVVPYQATVSSQTESALENIVDALETSVVDRLTGEDLQDILIDVIQTYLNISFYLGDEQIARHANSGNLKLGRRYNTIRTGEA